MFSFLKNLTFYQIIISFIIIYIVFIQWLVEDFYLPQIVGWIPEFTILVLAGLVVITEKKGLIFISSKPVLIFVVITLISFAVNRTPLPSLILFARMLARYYLLGCIVYSIKMDEEQEKFFIDLIIKLLILQIFIAPIKFFFWEYGEKPMSLMGHAVTTFTALMGFALAVSYGLVKKQWKKMAYMMFGFLLVIIAGGKRAVVFYISLVLGWAVLKLRSKKVAFKGKKLLIIVIILFIPVFFYITCRILPTLNPENKFWGTFSLTHIKTYATLYCLSVNPQTNLPEGRESALIMSVIRMSDNYKDLLLGYGPGIAIKSKVAKISNEDVIAMTGVSYGQSGVVWLLIQVGFLGAIFFYRIFLKLGYYAKYCFENDQDENYRLFYAFMILYTFIISFIAYLYDPAFKNIYTDSLYYILAGILCKRYDRVFELNKKLTSTQLNTEAGSPLHQAPAD